MPLKKPARWVTTISVRNTCCWAWSARKAQPWKCLRRLGVTPDQVRRQTRRVLQESSEYPGLGRPGDRQAGRQAGTQDPPGGPAGNRPDHPGGRRQAGPGHRAPDRDRARHPDPGTAHQEQPGADRRTGRGQDRHRRGTCPAHHRRRRARAAAGQTRPETGRGLAGGRARCTAASSRNA